MTYLRFYLSQIALQKINKIQNFHREQESTNILMSFLYLLPIIKSTSKKEWHMNRINNRGLEIAKRQKMPKYY